MFHQEKPRGRRALQGKAAAALPLGLCLALVTTNASAADKPTPPSRAEAAVLYDLEKIVQSKANSGWKIDRYEIDAMMPDALESVCAAPEVARLAALDRQTREVERLGGPVEEAFRKNGGKLGELSDLLAATRVRDLLTEAIQRAPKECPFWIVPRREFRGIQTDEGRFTLNLETGGLFSLRISEGRVLLGGGWLGRLLLARGWSKRWTTLWGLEVGGFALVDQGAEETSVPLGFVTAAPIVMRHVRGTWHFDLEAAPVAYLTSDDLRPSFGGRAGVAIGVSTIRIRSIMPWAGVQLSGEFFPGTDLRPATTILKAGARFGFDWDF